MFLFLVQGVDNYGDGDTPIFGRQIAAFQGHHQRPWTITQREFCNNMHQVISGCTEALPAKQQHNAEWHDTVLACITQCFDLMFVAALPVTHHVGGSHPGLYCIVLAVMEHLFESHQQGVSSSCSCRFADPNAACSGFQDGRGCLLTS